MGGAVPKEKNAQQGRTRGRSSYRRAARRPKRSRRTRGSVKRPKAAGIRPEGQGGVCRGADGSARAQGVQVSGAAFPRGRRAQFFAVGVWRFFADRTTANAGRDAVRRIFVTSQASRHI